MWCSRLLARRGSELDSDLLDFGPPPAEARLPAPVPYDTDTSISGEKTMAALGASTHSIEAQLGSLRDQLESGRPLPLS